MRNLFEINDWKIIQDRFDPNIQREAESIFSIGNGSFGQRANFEEKYSGDTLQGSYVGGVYYPDKTRVGWWKNGYPEYFAKVLNSCHWSGIHLEYANQEIDLAKCEVKSFYRELNLKTGVLYRKCRLMLQDDKEIEIESKRFCSMDQEELAAIEYSVTPINFSGNCNYKVFLDNNTHNEDSNYDEFFWERDTEMSGKQEASLSARTKKTNFLVAAAMNFSFTENNELIQIDPELIEDSLYVSNNFEYYLEAGKTYSVKKYVSLTSSINHPEPRVLDVAINNAQNALKSGFNALMNNHCEAWSQIWKNADVKISGDVAAQQAIRFNIFHLYQTYTGNNAKLNIGPKGFTGEKYGGATYWDTEAYCIPFYLKSADSKVSKQLLMYRYKHLEKAIENAEKLGFKNGAALYPMVTMNGEECHNEWEITFEEIHRNGAIAFAIYNYWRHTSDDQYITDFGKKVLIAISRFWFQRFNWSESRKKYVMLGVTGPNEYENNVNNNWYTNYIAKWCLNYTLDIELSGKYGAQLLTDNEIKDWQELIPKIELPKIEDSNIFLQQDGFLDKELRSVDDLSLNERPINQNWSWDRILRSVYIKQADVLQGIYLFEDQFTTDEIKDNFDFYEPKTVHESSLSPCIHSILASRIGYDKKAYEMYLRNSRLDLDDYNNEVREGLHITSMAGTCLSVIEGFGGVRITEDEIRISPKLPKEWSELGFHIRYKKSIIKVNVTPNSIHLEMDGNEVLSVILNENPIQLLPGKPFFLDLVKK